MNETLKNIKRISQRVKQQLWNNSFRTGRGQKGYGCPHLRFNVFLKSWIALGEDPCPDCKNERCENHGKEFKDQKRLVILGDV